MNRPAGGLLGLALIASACAKPTASPPPRGTNEASLAPARVWSYEVVEDGANLDVTASFPAGSSETLSIDESSGAFVSDLAVTGGEAISPHGGVWTVPACMRGCTLHYRFRLVEAGRSLGDIDNAVLGHGCVEAPPSTWLLRPTDSPDGTTYRFHVQSRPDSHFATGVRPIAGAADTYGADASDLDTAPYSLFGPFRARTMTRPTATIELAIAPGALALDDALLERWVDLSARAIEAYYGRFPVPRVLLLIAPHPGGRNDTVEGRTLSSGGSSIFLGVSSGMTEAEIPRDWVLTHEMTHLALPTLPRQNHWLEEGLATYVEPIARAKVGTITESEVWRGLIDGLPMGEPDAADEGLDRTHTWGRTYWGGALFSFVADIAIRQRTGNRRSLEDALRGILAAGGNGEERWPMEDALREGDKAVGAPVLEELYAKWATAPVRVDLPELWRELGVRATGATAISFDDAAPLAPLRRGIVGERRERREGK